MGTLYVGAQLVVVLLVDILGVDVVLVLVVVEELDPLVGGTVEDIEEVYDLFVRREIEPAYTEIGFEEIGDGLERLRRNEVTGRLVARSDR